MQAVPHFTLKTGTGTGQSLFIVLVLCVNNKKRSHSRLLDTRNKTSFYGTQTADQ